MGLALSVGNAFPAEDAGTIIGLDELLASANLPPHVEPTNVAPWDAPVGTYSALHVLRRAAAWLDSKGRLPPEPGLSEDSVLTAYYEALQGKRASP